MFVIFKFTQLQLIVYYINMIWFHIILLS